MGPAARKQPGCGSYLATTLVALFLVIVLWSIISPKDPKPADTAITNRSEPTTSLDLPEPDETPEADAAGAVPPTTSVPAIPNGLCRSGDPLANVYHPARLHVVDACRTVSGTVSKVKPEDDGDYHINLTLDPPFASLINAQNTQKQGGDLVVEIVPADRVGCTPGQPPKPPKGDYDYGVCTGAYVKAPAKGEHVQVAGPYVLDTAHGWMEIHPAWAIVETGDMALTSPLPGSPAPAPTPAAPPPTSVAPTVGVPTPQYVPPPTTQYIPPTTTTYTPPTTAYIAPTTAAAGNVVHQGAFCSPLGATGVTSAGTPMVCSTTPSDPKARWRAA